MQPSVRAHGVCRIGHGDNRAARALARLMRLPPAGDAVDTRLVITPAADGERWLRTFGAHALETRQYQAGDGAIGERFGLLEFLFRRESCDGGTTYRQLGVALVLGSIRIPLPRWCAPRVIAREDPDGDRRIRIDVRVELPAVGPVLTYSGSIELEDARG